MKDKVVQKNMDNNVIGKEILISIIIEYIDAITRNYEDMLGLTHKWPCTS